MKSKKQGAIEAAEQELQVIQDKIRANVLEYNSIWEERNNFLDSGEVAKVVKAKELEQKFYYLRDTVANNLDQERIQAVYKVERLQAEAEKLKAKLLNDTKILDRQKVELDEFKQDYIRQLADKQSKISNTEAILKETEQELLELEGA